MFGSKKQKLQLKLSCGYHRKQNEKWLNRSTCFKVILSGKTRSWTVWFLVQRWTQKTVKWKKNKHTTPPPQRRHGSHEKTKYSQLSHITKCNTFAKGVTVQQWTKCIISLSRDVFMLGNVCTDKLTSRHFVCVVFQTFQHKLSRAETATPCDGGGRCSSLLAVWTDRGFIHCHVTAEYPPQCTGISKRTVRSIMRTLTSAWTSLDLRWQPSVDEKRLFSLVFVRMTTVRCVDWNVFLIGRWQVEQPTADSCRSVYHVELERFC